MIKFQLTHPTRGATYYDEITAYYDKISTHTPHTGCDTEATDEQIAFENFNSHTPHGVR